MDENTITLAGDSYEVKSPLTLGQIIDLRVTTALPPSGDIEVDIRKTFDRSLNVIVIGLKATKPDLTVEKLKDMAISEAELSDAVSKILRISGLVIDETKASGEAQAA